MTRRGVFDLTPALEGHHAGEIFDWWNDHMRAWSLLVATAVTAQYVEDDNSNYMLFERLVTSISRSPGSGRVVTTDGRLLRGAARTGLVIGLASLLT